MKRIVLSMCGGFLIVGLGCAVVFAQAAAQISGTAKDQSGAVLPGVEVRVTQTETGITRDTVTNETGSYVLTNLPIGPYRLEASLAGFRTYLQTGIVFQVNSSPSINVVLEIGQVSEQIAVQGNATLVETRNVGVGQVVENTRILELPLNGRQAVELIALAGAATPARIAAGKFEPDSLPQAGLGSAQLGIQAFSYTSYFIPVNVTGGFNINHTAGSARDAIFAANDDLSVLRGNHQIAFGANVAMWWVNSYTNTYHTRFAFSGSKTGLGMADYFIGHSSEFNAGPSVPQNKRDKYIGLYAADTWKLNPKATLSYGLRWQPYTPMIHRDGSALHFDVDALKAKRVKT